MNAIPKTRSNRLVTIKAVICALMMPGLGQLYNREYIKGAAVFFSFALTIPFFTLMATKVIAPLLFLIVLLGSAVSLGIFIFGIVDAVRRAGTSVSPSPALYVWILILVPPIGYGGVLFPVSQYIRNNVLESFYAPTESMSPAISVGDLFFVDKDIETQGGRGELKRGDIVVFTDPNHRNRYFVKRLIGLPGDTIELNNATLFVNGRKMTTSNVTDKEYRRITTERTQSSRVYKVYWNSETTDAFTVTVPAGSMFVLGDNRANSVDSRTIGSIPLQSAVGIAKQIWFTRKPNNTHRIGTLLDINR